MTPNRRTTGATGADDSWRCSTGLPRPSAQPWPLLDSPGVSWGSRDEGFWAFFTDRKVARFIKRVIATTLSAAAGGPRARAAIPELREDAYQEVHVTCWRLWSPDLDPGRGAPVDSYSPWLARVSMCKAIDQLRPYERWAGEAPADSLAPPQEGQIESVRPSRSRSAPVETMLDLIEDIRAQKTLPVDHPQLLVETENLAAAIARHGDLDTAREFLENVLASRERSLPADHPDLLGVRANLAAILFRQGDLDGAREHQEAVLAAIERPLPADHPHVLDAIANLASTLHRMGETERARALEQEVAASRSRSPESAALGADASVGSVLEALIRVGVVRILAPLDNRERWLLDHFYLNGKTATEVARELGKSPTAVRSKLARLKAKVFASVPRELRDKLEDLMEDDFEDSGEKRS